MRRFPAHPPSGGGRTGEAAAHLAWRSVPWAPPAVNVDLIDRKGAWALEEMEQGMAEHWMGYRRAMNRRKLAGSGLA